LKERFGFSFGRVQFRFNLFAVGDIKKYSADIFNLFLSVNFYISSILYPADVSGPVSDSVLPGKRPVMFQGLNKAFS